MYKRDEHNKKRQIAGTRAYVSDAKAFKYTRGFGNRGRAFHSNNYGNNRGREYRRPNDYIKNNNFRRENNPDQNRDYENDRAMEMERLMAVAGNYDRNRRSYNRHPEDDNQSDVSYNDNLSGYSVDSKAIDDAESLISQQDVTGKNNHPADEHDDQAGINNVDSLELDEILPINDITVETIENESEMNEDKE